MTQVPDVYMEEKKDQTATPPVSDDVEKNKGMAILAYFIFFLPLLTDSKDSPFVKFHVKQSIMIVLLIVASFFVNIIPILGQLAFMVASVAAMVFWIIGIMNAVNGKMTELPVIGKYADQILKF